MIGIIISLLIAGAFALNSSVSGRKSITIGLKVLIVWNFLVFFLVLLKMLTIGAIFSSEQEAVGMLITLIANLITFLMLPSCIATVMGSALILRATRDSIRTEHDWFKITIGLLLIALSNGLLLL